MCAFEGDRNCLPNPLHSSRSDLHGLAARDAIRYVPAVDLMPRPCVCRPTHRDNDPICRYVREPDMLPEDRESERLELVQMGGVVEHALCFCRDGKHHPTEHYGWVATAAEADEELPFSPPGTLHAITRCITIGLRVAA